MLKSAPALLLLALAPACLAHDGSALTFVPDEPPADAAPAAPIEPKRPYGAAGSSWLTFDAGYAPGLSDDSVENVGRLSVTYSRFLADDLEFGLELGGWYFDQTVDSTGGISGSMLFRWHFLHDDAYRWSVFADIGIGVLGTFDEVPDGGTGFNFLPRAGAGFSHVIGDDGSRFVTGVRWLHISNGRIEGDARNPAFDSVMIYAGLSIPLD